MNFKRIVNIDFRRCSIGLRKGKCFILLLTILGLVVGILVTVFGVSKENEYTATSSVYCISYGDYTESQSARPRCAPTPVSSRAASRNTPPC